MYAGLRRGELLALRLKDLNLAEGVIWVSTSHRASPGHRAERRARLRVDRRQAVHSFERDATRCDRLGTREQDSPEARAGTAAADLAPRVSPHVRLADDRRQRERAGPLDVHGPRKRDDHLRPLRTSHARERDGGGRAARRLSRSGDCGRTPPESKFFSRGARAPVVRQCAPVESGFERIGADDGPRPTLR
jgi:integrase